MFEQSPFLLTKRRVYRLMDAVEYRNSRPQEDSPLPVATYHATTAPEEYDLVRAA